MCADFSYVVAESNIMALVHLSACRMLLVQQYDRHASGPRYVLKMIAVQLDLTSIRQGSIRVDCYSRIEKKIHNKLCD